MAACASSIAANDHPALQTELRELKRPAEPHAATAHHRLPGEHAENNALTTHTYASSTEIDAVNCASWRSRTAERLFEVFRRSWRGDALVFAKRGYFDKRR